jgi:hypothetical protein
MSLVESPCPLLSPSVPGDIPVPQISPGTFLRLETFFGTLKSPRGDFDKNKKSQIFKICQGLNDVYWGIAKIPFLVTKNPLAS